MPSKHTPGPWMWDEVPLPGLGPDRWCQVLNADDGTAVLRHEASGGPTPWHIKPGNARLIAAAPDLLEAAKSALDWYYPRQGYHESLGALRAAILKVEDSDAS